MSTERQLRRINMTWAQFIKRLKDIGPVTVISDLAARPLVVQVEIEGEWVEIHIVEVAKEAPCLNS